MIGHNHDMRKKGSQEGTVWFSSGKWRGQFYANISDLNGDQKYERRSVTLDAGNKKAAKRELREKYVSSANDLNARPDGTATLRQFVESRFRPDHIAALRKGGQIHYQTQLNHILPSLGDMRLTDITTMAAQRLMTAKAAILSAQSVRHVRNALSAVLGYARDLEFITGRLATEAVKIPAAAPVQRRALTADQVKALLAEVADKYRPVLIFLLGTGARASEAAGLRWQDVNLSDAAFVREGEARMPRTVHFRQAWRYNEYAPLKSGKSRRDVPMTAAVWLVLQTLNEQRDHKSDVVFSACRFGESKPMDMHNLLNRVIKPLGAKLGMPWLDIHSLRHTVATRMDATGASMGQRVLVLGHSDQRTTMGYTHADGEAQREMLEKAVGGVN